MCVCVCDFVMYSCVVMHLVYIFLANSKLRGHALGGPAHVCSRTDCNVQGQQLGGRAGGSREVGEDERAEWVFNRVVGWRDFDSLRPEVDYLTGVCRFRAPALTAVHSLCAWLLLRVCVRPHI